MEHGPEEQQPGGVRADRAPRAAVTHPDGGEEPARPPPPARATAAGVTPRTSAIAAPLSSPAKACAIAGRTRAAPGGGREGDAPEQELVADRHRRRARAAAKARAAEGCTPWPWNQRSTPPIQDHQGAGAERRRRTDHHAAGGLARRSAVLVTIPPHTGTPRQGIERDRAEDGGPQGARPEELVEDRDHRREPHQPRRAASEREEHPRRPRRHGLAAPTLRGRLHGAAAYAPMSGLERRLPSRSVGGW